MTFSEAFLALKAGCSIARPSSAGRRLFVVDDLVYVDVGRARILWLFNFEDFDAVDWKIV